MAILGMKMTGIINRHTILEDIQGLENGAETDLLRGLDRIETGTNRTPVDYSRVSLLVTILDVILSGLLGTTDAVARLHTEYMWINISLPSDYTPLLRIKIHKVSLLINHPGGKLIIIEFVVSTAAKNPRQVCDVLVALLNYQSYAVNHGQIQ